MKKKQKKTVTKWVCCNCGGTNVQTKMWVDLNTNLPTDNSDMDSSDNWCEDCEDHHDVDLKEITETK